MSELTHISSILADVLRDIDSRQPRAQMLMRVQTAAAAVATPPQETEQPASAA